MLQPKQGIGIGGKPSAPQSRTAIRRREGGLNSNEAKELGASGGGERVEGAESVLGAAAAEDGEGLGAEDGEEREGDSGDADEEAECGKDDNG